MLTLELRWFVAKPVDDRELRAFADAGRVEARVDHYLLGTGDDLGIKRRGPGALLEHKRCLARTPVMLAIDGAPRPVMVERWHKRWPDRDDPSTGAQTWIAVDKRRAVRRFGSCRAELTRLQVESLADLHSTLAIETTEVDAIAQLLRSAESLLRAYPQLAATFREAESCGYPAWLRALGARWGSNPQSSG